MPEKHELPFTFTFTMVALALTVIIKNAFF